MKRTALYLIISALYFSSFSQEIYDPQADASAQLEQAISKAKAQDKHVLLQIGGNWCPWCLRFHNFCTENQQIDSLMRENYIWIMINYSRKNKNMEIMKQLGFPQRFGFPVLVILNADGERIHTQNSGYLESGNSYNAKNVIRFLKNWSPKALKPENYGK